jgi:hypothetical protein
MWKIKLYAARARRRARAHVRRRADMQALRAQLASKIAS